jgi:macrolide transport system ATP-binding/permease protein
MPETLIDVRDLSRTYHAGDIDIHALNGVSLTIARGEFVAIVGASGSGKSTLMAILGCLDRPTSGEYWFEGVDVATLSEPDLAHLRSERIGYVFQSFNLLPRTSAIENVALPLYYAASAPPSRRGRLERARAMLGLVGLGEREGNTPAQLSGGQQQRVAMARALINAPGLICADEPTGNLDSKTSHEVMATLARLNVDQGVTVVLVTHESDIAAYAGRIITMRDGAVASDEQNSSRTPLSASPGRQSTASQPSVTAQRRPAVPFAFASMAVGAAFQAVRRNGMRSALTMLGVLIGVAALMAMVAVGQGARESVRKQIESLGTNLVVVLPGASRSGGVRSGFGSAPTLTVDDAEAIRREAPAVSDVAYLNRQSAQVQAGNRNWQTTVQGVTPDYPALTAWRIQSGRALTEEDERDGTSVALIGATVFRQLFSPTDNPIGATILVKRSPMVVVGLLADKGQTAFGQDQDDIIMIPFATAERRVLGVSGPSPAASTSASSSAAPDSPYVMPANPFGLTPRLTGIVNSIYLQARTAEDVDTAIDQATTVLTRRHHIALGQDEDFSIRNLSQVAGVVESSSRVMTLLLAAVASISLVVGGIGIMNILLVSVTERTREIGLRMAIGARRFQVLLQFLDEAVLLSVGGGIVGIIVGFVASRLISVFAGWPTATPLWAVLGGFLFSGAVGIFFGYYPARKASRLNPMEALRYE